MKLVQPLGVLALVAWVMWLHATRLASPTYGPFTTSRFWWTVAFVVCLQVTSYGVGLPELVRGRKGAVSAGLGAIGASAVAISLAQLLVGQALLPRAVVFGTAVLLVPWYVVCAAFVRDGDSRAAARDRVLVVGSWTDVAALSEELESGAERPAVVVESLTPEDAMVGADGVRPLLAAADATGTTVVVLDRVAQLDASIVAQAALLHERGVRIRTLSLFSEEWLGKLPLSELERVSLMFDIGELHRARYVRFKRVVDLLLAGAGLVVFVAALPVVLIGNAIGNRGPLFFRQARVGKGGRVITILKFRTMRETPDGAGEWTSSSDPRIAPFGGFMRRTHLDELPQVLNILRGDLSTVGPRPEQVHYVEELSEKLPFYGIRHLVRPGLTGWAQVKFHYASSDSDALEKLQYEFYYLRHQRMSLDLRIVARTLRSTLRCGGR